ncbi:COX15/CtaA family protein [Marilutibacter maris]|uniref:Cytochrome oxidase assembly protein n=1 Tax=Marilutibacter maris TaxID=1605891 RepID=A0A2U9T808_9GAMM|nr:COX15/CtaA family protein [Lysobacter maris]AWV08711.1 cytochrome oxidase assembly protein [Lysobacter maris]
MNTPFKAATFSKHFHRIAWLAVALATCVIVFGAFVRLSNAGLSCPDWPTCYGRATWPGASADAVDHAASAIRPFESHKAWREQVHRHLAATLGLLVLALALLAARKRRYGMAQILVAAGLVAIGIPLYMHGEHVAASALAILGEAILLAAALRWSNLDLSRVAALTLAVIIFQALLGMWTVTWLLKPIVVMGHLLGGLLTFSLLLWMAWRATAAPIRLADTPQLRRWVVLGLLLLGVQIALGGWTSANYAALACGNDFPTCVGQWWPRHDFGEAFVLWRGIGVDYEGGILDGEARIAIQLAHRMMAMVVFAYLIAFAVRLMRLPGMRGWGVFVLAMALVQVGLGIANVMLNLPLVVAVLHNAGAVVLLFAMVSLLARLEAPEH